MGLGQREVSVLSEPAAKLAVSSFGQMGECAK